MPAHYARSYSFIQQKNLHVCAFLLCARAFWMPDAKDKEQGEKVPLHGA